MPNFALHELAHAYHDRVLPSGFTNPEIKAAYEKAKAGGKYDRVERRHGNGRPNTFERAYAMENPMEYFAETSEAFLSRNDFFPFTRDELKRHDPDMFALLEKLWGTDAPTSRAQACSCAVGCVRLPESTEPLSRTLLHATFRWVRLTPHSDKFFQSLSAEAIWLPARSKTL